MNGDTGILSTMDSLVSDELRARDQWLLYSRIVDNWGLRKLAKRLMQESEEEAGHAQNLIERMIFLQKVPSMDRIALSRENDLLSMYKKSMELELGAVSAYRGAIKQANTSDPTSRRIFEKHLKMEEHHVNWLEEQMFLLNKLGEPLYTEMQV